MIEGAGGELNRPDSMLFAAPVLLPATLRVQRGLIGAQTNAAIVTRQLASSTTSTSRPPRTRGP